MHIEPQIALHAARPLMAAAVAQRRALENVDGVTLADPHPRHCGLSDSTERLKRWDPAGEVVKVALLASSPAQEWEAMTIEFYLTFWSLSLYDIKVPMKAYDGQIALLRCKYNTAQRELDDPEKRKKEMSRCLNTIEALSQELAVQKDHCRQVLGELQACRDTLLGAVVMASGRKLDSCERYFNFVEITSVESFLWWLDCRMSHCRLRTSAVLYQKLCYNIV